MASGVILQRNAGVTIPETYLDALGKLQLKAFGVAVVDKQKGMKIAHFDDVNMDVIKAALADNKDVNAVFHFALYPSTFDKADIQPFLLLCEDDDMDKPLLCAMMEGDFIVNDTKSAHLDVWHTADYLIDKVNQTYDMCNKDMEKLLQVMQSKSFKAEVAARIKSSGTVAFMAADGEPWLVDTGREQYSRKFEGWYTSSVIGWNPNKIIDKDNASERKTVRSFAEMRGKLPISNATPGIVGTRTDTAIPPSKETLTLLKDAEPALSRISQNTINKAPLKELRKLARQMSWDDKTPPELMVMPDGMPITDKAQIDWSKVRIINKEWKAWEKLQLAKAEAGNKDYPKAVQAEGGELSLKEKLALKRQREADAKKAAEALPPVPEPEKVVEEPVKHGVREFVPISEPKQREVVENIIIDIITEGERKIPPPNIAKEMDKMTFSERFGLTSVTEVQYEDGDLWTICHESPRDAFLMIKEAMANLMTVLDKKAPATTDLRQKVA